MTLTIVSLRPTQVAITNVLPSTAPASGQEITVGVELQDDSGVRRATDATTTVDIKLSGTISLAAGTTQTVIAPGSSTGSITLTLANTTCNTLSTGLTICVTDNSLRTTT